MNKVSHGIFKSWYIYSESIWIGVRGFLAITFLLQPLFWEVAGASFCSSLLMLLKWIGKTWWAIFIRIPSMKEITDQSGTGLIHNMMWSLEHCSWLACRNDEEHWFHLQQYFQSNRFTNSAYCCLQGWGKASKRSCALRYGDRNSTSILVCNFMMQVQKGRICIGVKMKIGISIAWNSFCGSLPVFKCRIKW